MKDKSLAICSIVFEDCLKLNNIRLFKNKKGYYLVLPSKQDVYQEMQDLNNNNIIIPQCERKEKQYDEFFFPLENELYELMLNTILNCFNQMGEKSVKSFKYN